VSTNQNADCLLDPAPYFDPRARRRRRPSKPPPQPPAPQVRSDGSWVALAHAARSPDPVAHLISAKLPGGLALTRCGLRSRAVDTAAGTRVYACPHSADAVRTVQRFGVASRWRTSSMAKTCWGPAPLC